MVHHYVHVAPLRSGSRWKACRAWGHAVEYAWRHAVRGVHSWSKHFDDHADDHHHHLVPGLTRLMMILND